MKNYSFQENHGKLTDFHEIHENNKFSDQTDSRSPHFIEKIQIFHISLFPTIPQNLMKSWKLSDFLEKYIILKHFTRAFQ